MKDVGNMEEEIKELDKEYEFKSYKEKQAHYKRINEERGKFLFISKVDPKEKGKTYKKPKRIIMKDEGGNE